VARSRAARSRVQVDWCPCRQSRPGPSNRYEARWDSLDRPARAASSRPGWRHPRAGPDPPAAGVACTIPSRSPAEPAPVPASVARWDRSKIRRAPRRECQSRVLDGQGHASLRHPPRSGRWSRRARTCSVVDGTQAAVEPIRGSPRRGCPGRTPPTMARPRLGHDPEPVRGRRAMTPTSTGSAPGAAQGVKRASHRRSRGSRIRRLSRSIRSSARQSASASRAPQAPGWSGLDDGDRRARRSWEASALKRAGAGRRARSARDAAPTTTAPRRRGPGGRSR
jgi:hypothetical protein